MSRSERSTRLIDGREVSTWSAEWRLECLARHVLRHPFGFRRPWLDDFERRNGKPITDELKSTMNTIHGAQRSTLTKVDERSNVSGN